MAENGNGNGYGNDTLGRLMRFADRHGIASLFALILLWRMETKLDTIITLLQTRG